jgi:hypothetical protein
MGDSIAKIPPFTQPFDTAGLFYKNLSIFAQKTGLG